jgi:hypothetical protein
VSRLYPAVLAKGEPGEGYINSPVRLDFVHVMFSYTPLPQPHWYDPETDPSQFMAGLWKFGNTRAERVRMTVPGSHVLVQAIMSAIDDYAERETGNREYFWGKPHSAG